MSEHPVRITPIEVERIVVETLSRFRSVILAYLFGSFSAGRPHAFSDVDVGIYFQEFSMDEFMKVNGSLSMALGGDVDVIPLNTAPPLLRYNIVKEGKRLVSRDETTRILFESKAMVEGLDEKPLIEMVRKENMKRLLT